MFSQLHFIRPEFFLLLIPLAMYLLWLLVFRGLGAQQFHFLDRALADAIVTQPSHTPHRKGLTSLLIFAGSFIAIVALAGPSFTKLPQPVVQDNNALIILLDLSTSMNSTDIKPSRLLRAKQKVTDILNTADFTEIALIAYAADAYLVTPLTDDTNTIATHLPNLDSTIINQQGSRIDRALTKALDLFTQTRITQGLVIALTDDITLNAATEAALNNLRANNFLFSALAIASNNNTPIPKAEGGFVTDSNGTMVLTQFNPAAFNQATRLGGGQYRSVSVDRSDINALLSNPFLIQQTRETDQRSDEWLDLGGYLVWLLLPFMLLLFRKGLWALLPCCILLTPNESYAFEWRDLFLNDNQRAYQAFQNQEYAEAAQTFSNKDWRASSAFKQGDFQTSLELWQGDTARDFYNRGNAYAQLGDIPAAINAYQAALARDPQYEDAQYNLDVLQQLQENAQQSSDNAQQNNNDSSQQDQQAQQQPSGDGEDNAGDANQQTQEDASPATGEGSDNNDENKLAEQQLSEALSNQDETDRQDELNNAQQAPSDLNADSNASIPPEDQGDLIDMQWLERIQDDPSGLLKRKFNYQDYINQPQAEEKPW